MQTGDIRDFTIDIPQGDLDGLDARLANTRYPEAETVEDWSQGAPLSYVRALADYWASDYDWRQCETALNGLPNYLIEIDGLDIHFIHVRSQRDDARPLLITHGWPGSVVEFLDIIEPLTNPDDESDPAFHLVMPSLPGFGFSGKPAETGWTVQRIAKAWAALMNALGYDRWFAQGGDWGSAVTTQIGSDASADDAHGCKGIHLNMCFVAPPEEVMQAPTPDEVPGLMRLKAYMDEDSGYSKQQSTRPQTLGYGLADSPVGQMAWIIEKFHRWSDIGEDAGATPDAVFSRDRMLDDVMVYWLTNSGASSARLYWESFNNAGSDPVAIPTGFSRFPKEIFLPSRRWAETRLKNIVYWEDVKRGGHFAAMERPELFVNELRACFGAMAL